MKTEGIQERPASYRVILNYYQNGERKVYSRSFNFKKYGGKSKALTAAKVHRNKMTEYFAKGFQNVSVSFREAFSEMIEHSTLSDETIRKYTLRFNKYYGSLAKDPIDKITTLDLQDAINKMVTSSDDVIAHTVTIAKKIFHYALLKGWVMNNPAELVTIPRSKAIKKTKDVRTTKQDLDEVIERIENSIIKDKELIIDALMMMYYTGARPAEVLALTEADIDRDNRVITINKSIDSSGQIRPTKTAHSVRTVPYPKEAEKYVRGDYIRADGRRLLSRNINETLYRLTKGKFRPYMLRHLYSTDLIRSGADLRTIQELMGHDSSSMTLEYARSSEEAKREAIEKRG